MKRAIAQSGIPCEISQFSNAHLAIDSMEKIPATRESAPHLIVSDLKMFGMTGIDFTRWVRGSRFGNVPVIILTGSCLVEDILAAYGSGANAFVTKPANFFDLRNIITRIITYWNALQRRS